MALYLGVRNKRQCSILYVAKGDYRSGTCCAMPDRYIYIIKIMHYTHAETLGADDYLVYFFV